MSSISRLTLAAFAAVSFIFFAGTFMLLSGFGDRMLQKATAQNLQSLANVTFTTMYQIMNQGWKREQVSAFAASVEHSVVGTPLAIRFHRSEVVDRQFGSIRQENPDEAVAAALKTGARKEITGEEGVRFLFPMRAKAECLGCHSQAKKEDVLGVIDIRAGYSELIGNTRQHILLVLLLLAPIPLFIGFLVALVLDSRMNRFVSELDASIDNAKPGEAPDFNGVRTHFSEFRELLGHFKRLVKA